MRVHDIRLREAARRGDPAACVEMAARLFGGRDGFARNVKLGFAYLQQEIQNHSSRALNLVGAAVPLADLVAPEYERVLVEAAQCGSSPARLKLGLLQVVRFRQREQGRENINLSGLMDRTYSPSDMDSPAAMATLLDVCSAHVGDANVVLIASATALVGAGDVEGACFCIRTLICMALPAEGSLELVLPVVRAAARSSENVDLPVDWVEPGLARLSEDGEVDAQYILGCALAGLGYGQLRHQQVVRRTNFRRAVALLLRAADGGIAQAWYQLFKVTSDYRSSAANQELARYFLEKAAAAHVAEAQARLGALLLREAESLAKAEGGIQWLVRAADQGHPVATELLATLRLPAPELPDELASRAVETIRGINPDLAARLSLARIFHLTRREAMSLDLRIDLRPWGLVLRALPDSPLKGRFAPAVTPFMRAELQRESAALAAFAPVQASLVSHQSRAQRAAFKSLGVPESHFFANMDARRLPAYGFGTPWAARADGLLKILLEKPALGDKAQAK